MPSPAYFPYRAFKNRPYFKAFMELPDGKRDWAALAQLALFRTGDAFGRERKGEPRVTTCMMAESWLSSAVADFFQAGQAVFHLARPLRDALLTSDLGDACVADLRMPFPAVYVHLGADLGLTFNDGAAVLEGVFLGQRQEKVLSMTLVGALATTPSHWGERGLESFTLHLSNDVADRPLLAALTDHLARQAEDPNDHPELSDWSTFTETEKLSIQESWASHAEERELHQKNASVVLECAKLAANALLYISHYPDDVETTWQEGTPPAFREKYQRSDGKTRERTLSKARSSGYTLIQRVGHVFEAELATEGTGSSPAPHLRRAHWRRQAHGPKNSLRKLVWVRAVRVLGGTQRERPYLVVTEDQPESAP